jgi:N-acetylglucosaminyldiphosphoundecaprenol N-acetyl-beta-D-mannosaminyltransferase
MFPSRITGNILGTKVEVTTANQMLDRIIAMAETHRPAYVCFATAHMLVEASRDESIRDAYANAALVSPDGVPVAWSLRLLGERSAECVSGPQMTKMLLEAAAEQGIVVGFYGGRQETLDLMRSRLLRQYPTLQIAYAHSPPFRPLEQDEQRSILQGIRDAGVQLLFVGLGSIKQEQWMREVGPGLACVSLGVGAAFEFLSGEKVLPPEWIQRMGLAWLIRLCQEPRRLAKRNLYSPIFAWMVLRQWLTGQYKVPALVLQRDADASSESGTL